VVGAMYPLSVLSVRHAGQRDTAQSTQRNGPLQHVKNREAEGTLLKTYLTGKTTSPAARAWLRVSHSLRWRAASSGVEP